ncbi:hypothetical protein [Fontibacter flavus]|uniref:Uncharacterized protein n=1 Tax=Fontibacter flavus TaxID=654838 RepID=A0ABV6FSG7_9BACT
MKIKLLLLIFYCFFASLDQLLAQLTLWEREMGITEYGILTTEERVLVYKINRKAGTVEFYVQDENLQTIAFKEEKLSPNVHNVTYEADDRYAYIMISWGIETGYEKLLLKIDFNTGGISSYPISSNMVFPLAIRPIEDGIVMMGSIKEGDFLEIFNYQNNTLHSITDFFDKDTRIWDMQVLNNQLDVLVYSSGKSRFQQLQILSYDKDANRTLRLPVKLPADKKKYIRKAQLLYGPYEEYKIVGTYSFKPGEWFSGYFQIEINEFLDQNFSAYAFKDFDGFYDYKKNRKVIGGKNFNREMRLIEATTDGKYITLASQPIKTNRKFVHFLSIDAEGKKVFDKSIKLFYNQTIYSGSYQMANQEAKVFFLFRGNDNKRNLPGEKVFLIENGKLSSINQVQNMVSKNSKIHQLADPKYQHWYDNKFLIFGVVPPQIMGGEEPYFVIQKIEV